MTDRRKSVLDRRTDLDDGDTRPDYYGGPDAPFEPVKVINDVGLGAGFYFGSALKYLQRASRKGTGTADLKKAEWYLTTGVELGYTVPQEGAMNPQDVVEAWDVPVGLANVVKLILAGDVKAANVAIREYRAKRDPRPETAPMPFAKG